MFKYMLSTPYTLEYFQIPSAEELQEALSEFGLGYIYDVIANVYFIVSPSIEGLLQAMNQLELHGTVIQG